MSNEPNPEGFRFAAVEKRKFVHYNEQILFSVPERQIQMKSMLRHLASGSPDPLETTDPSSFFSRLPVIETESLTLRPMRMRDAEDIFRYASDPEVSRYVLWEPHRSISDSRAYIRYIRHLYRRGMPSSWAVVLRSSSEVIGSIGFMGYSYVHHTAEIGYSFSRNYWNLGYATQAAGAVIQTAFRSLPDLNRIEAQHDIRNPASGRVMLKCGMKQEGIIRSRIYNKSEFVDVALYAILRSDLAE